MFTAPSPAVRRWGVGAVVVGSLVLGCWARFVARSPLWLDEALTVNIARLPVGQIRGALLHDGHPPLYYWLLHGWMAAFGEGDLAVRSLSAVFSVATLPLLCLLARRVGGRDLAVGALVLLAISPYAVRYGSETRMYSLVMLLVVAGALLLDDVHRRPRWWNLAGLALTTGALLWTHYWALYLVGTLGVVLLAVAWRRPSERAALRRPIGALLAGGLLFVPWLPSLLEQARHTGTPWAQPSRPTQVVQTTLAELGGGGFAEALLAGTLLAILATFVLVDVAEDGSAEPVERDRAWFDSRWLLVIVAGAMAVGSGAAILMGGAYAPRYASIVAPFALIAVAAGALRIRPRWLQGALVAATVGLCSLAVVHNVGDLRTQAGPIAAALTKAAPDDLIVVCPDQLGPDLERALEKKSVTTPRLVYPDGRDPHVVDWADYETRNKAADPKAFIERADATAGSHAIWVVWQGGYRTLKGQCEAVVDGLSQLRPEKVLIRSSDAFEPASLWRFG